MSSVTILETCNVLRKRSASKRYGQADKFNKDTFLSMILLKNLGHRVMTAEEAKTKTLGHSKKASYAERLRLFLYQALAVQLKNIFLVKYITMCSVYISDQ